MSVVYPRIVDPPARGEPAFVCPEGHRTRWDRLHDETPCHAEMGFRQCCNRRAVLTPPVGYECSEGHRAPYTGGPIAMPCTARLPSGVLCGRAARVPMT